MNVINPVVQALWAQRLLIARFIHTLFGFELEKGSIQKTQKFSSSELSESLTLVFNIFLVGFLCSFLAFILS